MDPQFCPAKRYLLLQSTSSSFQTHRRQDASAYTHWNPPMSSAFVSLYRHLWRNHLSPRPTTRRGRKPSANLPSKFNSCSYASDQGEKQTIAVWNSSLITGVYSCRTVCPILCALGWFGDYSKTASQFYDPCQDFADRSLKCLKRNGYDREMCGDYFQYAFSSYYPEMIMGPCLSQPCFHACDRSWLRTILYWPKSSQGLSGLQEELGKSYHHSPLLFCRSWYHILEALRMVPMNIGINHITNNHDSWIKRRQHLDPLTPISLSQFVTVSSPAWRFVHFVCGISFEHTLPARWPSCLLRQQSPLQKFR